MDFVELDLGGGGGGAALFSAVVVICFVMIWAGAGTPFVVVLLLDTITWGGSLTSVDLGLRLFGDFLFTMLLEVVVVMGVILFENSGFSSTIGTIPTSLRLPAVTPLF